MADEAQAKPPKPLSPAWQAFNRMQGYGRSSRDGGLIKGAAAFDPTSKYNRGYDNNLPSVWTPYQGRQNNTAVVDPNPSFHSAGSPRKPYEPSY